MECFPTFNVANARDRDGWGPYRHDVAHSQGLSFLRKSIERCPSPIGVLTPGVNLLH
jgi:hypothetical protein